MHITLHSISTDTPKIRAGFHPDPEPAREIFLKVTLDPEEPLLGSLSRLQRSLSKLQNVKVDL